MASDVERSNVSWHCPFNGQGRNYCGAWGGGGWEWQLCQRCVMQKVIATLLLLSILPITQPKNRGGRVRTEKGSEKDGKEREKTGSEMG